MDERTLTALKRSIHKWQRIVDGTGQDDGVNNCPLCKEFWRDTKSERRKCAGCPIKRRTGQPECRGTPYWDWEATGDDWPEEGRRRVGPNYEGLTEAARMRDFLRSLLPVSS